MADYYFQMKDLSVGYNGNSLIHDINIGINKGEIVTLIGPNGSGKSTILKSITRQLKVVGGNVFFDDTSLLKLPYKELASKMAVVLTDRIKTELMTCHDIVATGRYPYTGRLGILTQEDERLVEEAMQAVHAQELGNRDFNAISDGQKQRVMLARALCQQPDIIVLDEPTSFLDIRYKLELLTVLKRMVRENDLAVLLTMARQDSGFSLYAGVYLAGMLLPIGAACWSAAIISRFTFSFLALTGTAVRFVIAHFFRSLGIAACTVALAVFTWNYPIWIFAAPACLMLLWSVFAEPVFAKYGAAITPVTPDED